MITFKAYRANVPANTHDKNQANPPDEVQFEGVEFSDGRVAVRWLTAARSVSVWDSMSDLLKIHGHPEYGTRIVYSKEEVPEPTLKRNDRRISPEVDRRATTPEPARDSTYAYCIEKSRPGECALGKHCCIYYK